MTDPLNKTKRRLRLGNLLYIFCLFVIVLRLFRTEFVGPEAPNPWLYLTDPLWSLSYSAVLLLAVFVWSVQTFFTRTIAYRYTAIEPGLAVFIIACLVSFYTTSNLRCAVTGFVTMAATMLTAVLLVQILDSGKKIKILLYTLAGLGAIVSLYCAYQLFFVNQMLLEQYNADPDAFLAKLGIASGSFQHMLLEHSLYSKDVRGFFTTGNSAGSFMLLTFFAALAMFIDEFKKLKSESKNPIGVSILAIVTLLCLGGLLITHSKGAILSAIIAVLMLIIYLPFAETINRHKKSILIICLSLFFLAVGVTIWYGLTYDRLPGGNSMLVRWQYWYSSAKMFADHPLTGVGPANFANYYPQYKIPAALETVVDPHNFLLSIAAQLGLIGLVGFLAAILFPLARITFAKQSSKNNAHKTTIAILFVAIIGFLIHNCIDFAMFEPPVLTTFWAVIAVLIATDNQLKNRPAKIYQLKFPQRLIAAVAVSGLVFAFISYAFLPVARATVKIKQAKIAVDSGNFDPAHNLLTEAADIDTLDPKPLILNGQLYLQRYYELSPDKQFLTEAEKNFTGAIARNDAYFKDHERLSDTCIALAEITDRAEQTDWFEKAYDSADAAVVRYPGSDRIRMKLALIAEQLDKIDIAVENYKKVIEIEDAYREQFEVMYPGKEVFSRLGQQKYQMAKDKIKLLTQ